jgi:hypothetical protein
VARASYDPAAVTPRAPPEATTTGRRRAARFRRDARLTSASVVRRPAA